MQAPKPPEQPDLLAENPAHINPNRLDREWVVQAETFHAAAYATAEARLKHAELTQEFDLVCAELDHEIRTHPARFDLPDKLTEKMIENTVIRQSAYQAALRAVNRAKFDLDSFTAAVGAIEHKKRGLEKLVDLRLADYYAEPKVRSGREEDFEEMQRQEVRSRGQRKHK